MATKFEYHDTGAVGVFGFGDNAWQAQTFTPSTSHKITSVKLMMMRLGTPGTLTIGIRETSAGKPTGGDLCVGTIDTSGFSTIFPEWWEIAFPSGAVLDSSALYAIVMRAPDAPPGELVYTRYGGAYGGGTFVQSGTSGSSWVISIYDLHFEEWGEVVVERTKTSSLDVLIQAVDEETSALDIYIKAEDEKDVALDILLKKLGDVSITVALDAVIVARESKASNIDILLQALSEEEVAALDAFIRATDEKTSALDVHVAARVNKTSALNVLLRAMDAETTSLDIIIGHHYPELPARQFTVEIHEPDGTLVAMLDEVFAIGYEEAVNEVGRAWFSMSLDDIKWEHVAEGRELWIREHNPGADNTTRTHVYIFRKLEEARSA